MKKFLAITASAVLALSVFAFTACKGGDDPAKYKYTEVDLSSQESIGKFVDEFVANVDPDKLFGDTEAEDFKLGLAAEVGVELNANASAKNVTFPGAEAPVDEVKASVSYKMDSSAKLLYSADGIAAEASTTLKASVTAPDELYNLLGYFLPLDEDLIATIKSVVSNINYTVKEYVDSDYLYVDYSGTGINDLLPEGFEDLLPESGKIKLPLGSGENNDTSHSAALTAAKAVADEAVDESTVAYKANLAMVVALLAEFDAKIETSTDNGYAVKISVDVSSILEALKEAEGVGETVAMIEQYAQFQSLSLNALLAVDKDGAFKELSCSVSAAADLTVDLATLIGDEHFPAITGSADLKVSMSVKNYDGKVNVPSNDNSYVDINTLFGDVD